MTEGIIVLGMHRSGTSLTAELVSRWGAYGSPRDLIPPGRWNRRGYWEYAPLVRFNDCLLQAVDSKWNVPPPVESAPRLSRLARRGEYRREGLELLRRMRSAGRPWFWKDPRLAILLPFWRELWKQVTYVVVIRDPLHIAASLLERDRLPVSASLLLWQRYMLDILRETHAHRSTLFLDYDTLLDRAAESERLAKFLGSRPDARRPMQPAVDRTLRHHRHKAGTDRSALTESQAELADMLQGLAAGRRRPPPSKLAACAAAPGWREYLIVLDLLRELSLLAGGEKQRELFSNLPASYRKTFGG